MKNIFFVLIIIFLLTSCQKKYEIYTENNQMIAQLLSIDKKTNTAYLVDYANRTDKNDVKNVEQIAKFYEIEGRYMCFYNRIDIDQAEKLNMDYTKFPIHYCFTPFEYRNEYINGNNDTIASLLWREGTGGYLYTTQKYTAKDSLLLLDIFKFLGLKSCFMYNNPIEIKMMSYMDCYSKYDLVSGFLFLDEVHDGDFFSLDDINIKRDENSRFYVKYLTNKYLSREQILEVLNSNKLSGEQNIVYFYIYTDLQKDYACIQYWEKYNKYSLFMYDERKEYEYDIQNKTWTTMREYK